MNEAAPVTKSPSAIMFDARTLLMDPEGIRWPTQTLELLLTIAHDECRLPVRLDQYPEILAARMTMSIVRNACRMRGREWVGS